MPKKKSEDREAMVQIAVRIEEDSVARLDEMARKMSGSGVITDRSKLIREAVRRFVKVKG